MTPTTTAPDALELPAALRRSTNGVTADKAPAARPAANATIKGKGGVTLAATARPKAEKPAAVLRAPKETSKSAVSTKARVKAAKEGKAPIVSKAHGPTPGRASTVVATEANPQKSIVPMRFKKEYAQHNDTNGDKIGLSLKAATTHKNEDGRDALDVKALAEIAAANGIDFSVYAKLNPGQQRMNVGNRLRGNLKRGTKVVIGSQTFANAEKALTKQAA